MGQIDYPELEKETVTVEWPAKIKDNVNDVRIKTGRVIGCNYDIGITIINKYNKDDFLLCLDGIWINGQTTRRTLYYKTLFYSLVNQIKKGRVQIKMVYKIIDILEPTQLTIAWQKPTQENCSYGR
jgi:hypothetical protein